MKKIFALLIVTLGLSVSANAQQKAAVKTTAKKEVATKKATATDFTKAAANDVAAINKEVTLSATDKTSLQGLFEYKHRELSLAAGNTKQQEVIQQTIDAKLRATLTAEQMKSLEKKPELLKAVTN
jgi:hypothetical protein